MAVETKVRPEGGAGYPVRVVRVCGVVPHKHQRHVHILHILRVGVCLRACVIRACVSECLNKRRSRRLCTGPRRRLSARTTATSKRRTGQRSQSGTPHLGAVCGEVHAAGVQVEVVRHIEPDRQRALHGQSLGHVLFRNVPALPHADTHNRRNGCPRLQRNRSHAGRKFPVFSFTHCKTRNVVEGSKRAETQDDRLHPYQSRIVVAVLRTVGAGRVRLERLQADHALDVLVRVDVRAAVTMPVSLGLGAVENLRVGWM